MQFFYYKYTEKKGNKNMSENRDFKGVWIPKEVWLDTRLNALDKVILIEIDSLDQGEKGCYASNEHLAGFCQCSERKVSEAISKLIKCGYVYVQNFDGRKRELRSRLSNSARQTSKKCEADTQNLQESNTENKTDNNTSNKKKVSKNETYDDLIEYYTDDDDLRQSLKAFIQMRKLIKKPLTNYALKLILNKLDKMSTDSKTKTAIVNQSVEHSWQGVFPLKEEKTNNKADRPTYCTNESKPTDMKPVDYTDYLHDGVFDKEGYDKACAEYKAWADSTRG